MTTPSELCRFRDCSTSYKASIVLTLRTAALSTSLLAFAVSESQEIKYAEAENFRSIYIYLY